MLSEVGVHVKDRWRSIGSELGISVNDLNAIGLPNPNPTHCITEVFSKWTASLSKTPVTWQTLLVTLCKPQVDQKPVADRVYKNFL